MYVVLVHFRVKSEFTAPFRKLIAMQAANSLRDEPDCHRFDVLFDPDDATKCLLYEIYSDRSAFDAHLQTPHFKEFNDAVESVVVDKEVTFWELVP